MEKVRSDRLSKDKITDHVDREFGVSDAGLRLYRGKYFGWLEATRDAELPINVD